MFASLQAIIDLINDVNYTKVAFFKTVQLFNGLNQFVEKKVPGFENRNPRGIDRQFDSGPMICAT